MKKIVKDERGFTLVEMLLVLLIVSVLILVMIPNISKHHQAIQTKGCQAYVKMIEGLVQAYEIDKSQKPTKLDDLAFSGYLDLSQMGKPYKCANGQTVSLNSNGEVVLE